MRWSIGRRIFLALTITSVVIIGLNAVATRWSFQRGFVDYLAEQENERISDVVEDLVEIYRERGSWQALDTDRRRWDELFRPSASDRSQPPPRRESGDRRPPPHGEPRPRDPLDLRARAALVDNAGRTVAGQGAGANNVREFEIVVDGAKVGRLLLETQSQLTESIDLRFAADQSRSSVLVGAAILILAALIAAIVARQIVRPVSSLTAGTRALTAGDFDRRITVTRNDELGDLARDFNQLAQTLQKNQQTRRQWVSDISHELRTPLSILTGELEAIEDGVRTFDEGTQRSLQAEVRRLSKLVGDLHDLTTSDEGGLRYRNETIGLAGVLRETIEAHRSRIDAAGLELQLSVPREPLIIEGDPMRISQLFSNLIENSIRYTDRPGTLSVHARTTGKYVSVVFEDSAPGVSGRDLPRLFDRLFRVDASRNRATGGSGLGLPICEAIVTAHDGEIGVEASDLGGVAITITLPAAALDEVQS